MLQTESVWLGKAEGVRVTFDTRRVDFAHLLAHAGRHDCDRFVWTSTAAQQELAVRAVGANARPVAEMVGANAPRLDGDQHYYLARTPLRHVPMTAVQATRVNAALHPADGGRADWRRWLSPQQLRWVERVTKEPEAGWPRTVAVPFRQAVAAFQRAARRRG